MNADTSEFSGVGGIRPGIEPGPMPHVRAVTQRMIQSEQGGQLSTGIGHRKGVSFQPALTPSFAADELMGQTP